MNSLTKTLKNPRAVLIVIALFVFSSLAVAAPPRLWEQKDDSPRRFKVLDEWGDAAVFDEETALVWERSPSTTPQTWEIAQFLCNNKNVGNRKGWRLPTIQELASLVDPTQANPALSLGHPFSNVQSAIYWSATTFASNASFAWVVFFGNGGVALSSKSGSDFVWCVRGGQGVDAQ